MRRLRRLRTAQPGLFCTLLSSLVWCGIARAQQVGRQQTPAPLFRAGACAVDVTPAAVPVLVNGGFLQKQATRLRDPIQARCLVLDDGATRLAIVVVDSCMMPRELLDWAKVLAREKTGLPTDRMLIAATHTHSAPAAMGALGCPADVAYSALLPGRIAESIERAIRNLEPARVGWNVIDTHAHTFCRRWIRRPDKMIDDPFGERTVRANMHPGYQNPDVIGPSGPVDPGLTVLSIQSRAGRPIALLANYSMHYYGAEPVSADYFGRFRAALTRRLGAEAVDPPFIAIMSQGTSGDQMWMDYSQPRADPGLEAYAEEVARVAHQATQAISYHARVPLAMAEATLPFHRRVPDQARLAWARKIVAQMKDGDKERLPRTLPEVYAREAILLDAEPERELKLQAVRIGELGSTAIPNEVFAITGLKLKAQSPFDLTMNIELANGAEGYIPPPEQHALGGYTTWPARTAGLEVQAEPRIVTAMLTLLERVAGKPRRELRLPDGPYAQAVRASRPVAYWRLEDMQGKSARDSATGGCTATYQGGVAFFLPGPDFPGFSTGKSLNRAVHFAGGRLKATLAGVGETFSVELWFWNGLPNEARSVTGYLLSRAADGAGTERCELLGISGTGTAPGRLFVSSGSASSKVYSGRTIIVPGTWHHVALVREPARIAVYLDGNPEPEISGEHAAFPFSGPAALFLGSRSDGVDNFEGKIDEVALYNRVLREQEIAQHVRAAKKQDLRGSTSSP